MSTGKTKSKYMKILAWIFILTFFTSTMVEAALTGSFSNTLWQIPTMKADTYYVGSSTIIANSTGLYGAEIYRNGQAISTYISSLGYATPASIGTWITGNDTAVKSTVSGWISGNLTVSSGSGVIPFSYVCWKSGSNYFANSTTGGTNYTGTNATSTIQSAITATGSAGGGVVFIKAGHYDIVGVGLSILSSNVILMGEGAENTYLHVASGLIGLTIGNGGDRIYFCGVEKLFIQHAATATTNSTGLKIKGLSHGYIRDISVESFRYGIRIDSTVVTTYNHYQNIKCIGARYGIDQWGSGSDNQGSWNQINLIGTGLKADGSRGWRHLLGNTNLWESMSIEGFNTGLDLDIGPTGWNLNNHFNGLFFENCSVAIDYNAARPGACAQFVGVWAATCTTIIGNYAADRGIDFTGLLVTSSGAKARNMGTTSVATGGTIAHDIQLGITPRVCYVGVVDSTACKVSWTWDATNITVYHDHGSAVNVFWYVEI